MNGTVCALRVRSVFLTRQPAHPAAAAAADDDDNEPRRALWLQYSTILILSACRREDSIPQQDSFQSLAWDEGRRTSFILGRTSFIPSFTEEVLLWRTEGMCRTVLRQENIKPNLKQKCMCMCTGFHQTLAFIIFNIEIYLQLIDLAYSLATVNIHILNQEFVMAKKWTYFIS